MIHSDKKMKIIYLYIITLLFFACQLETEPAYLPTIGGNSSKPTAVAISNIPTPEHLHYSWLPASDATETLVNRIAPPEGWQRMPVAKGSFAEWLRYLPLQEEGHEVRLFNGTRKANQQVHHAVVQIDVGQTDLQQCADAVMRLKAEFHFSKGDFEKIHFNFTSGDKVSFEDWRKGKRPVINGNKVSFVHNGKVSDSYTNFKAYLIQIFTYAGTASLTKELTPIPIADIQAGDVFIKGGFPGHAVLVLDVAINEAGEKRFLIGQSYMPAQEFHILKNDTDDQLSPWYDLPVNGWLETPEWKFNAGDLKTW
jgi:Domain of unknown function (4846)